MFYCIFILFYFSICHITLFFLQPLVNLVSKGAAEIYNLFYFYHYDDYDYYYIIMCCGLSQQVVQLSWRWFRCHHTT